MVVVAVALLVVAPQPDSVRVGAGGFPVSWLWSWLEVPGVWAGPPMPPTPKQASGTAAGKDHYVSSAATRAGKGSGGPRGKGVGELDPYQPHRQSVTPVTTGPARHGDGFNPATSKRVASAASATSDVYANADGSYTRKVFAEPVNYRTPDGSWQPIDTTLGRARLGAGADGRWHETANSVGVDVAGGGDDPTLVSVRPNAGSHAGSDAGQVLGYGLQGARPVTPTVAGSTATYPVVLPSTDVVLSSTATGVAQSLVLRSADAATSWLLPLRLTGLTARNTGGGGVEFVDAAGSVTATLLPGLMSDGRIDPASGNRAESTAVSFQMTSVGGVPAVRMTVDAGWVHDRARVFPVTVTSTVAVSAVGGSGSDGAMAAESGAAVMQHGLGGSSAVLPELRAGTFNGGQDVAQSLLTFGNFASTFAGLSMAEARLTRIRG